MTVVKNGFHPLSNFAYAPFVADGIIYFTMEQYLQVQKARTFGAHALANTLINTRSPRKCRQMGGDLDGINPGKGEAKVEHVMMKGLHEKFAQNNAAGSALRSAKATIIALADRFDSDWGVGLDESDERFQDRQQWGMNRLGQMLMMMSSNM